MGGWGPIVVAAVLSGAVLDARAEDVTSPTLTSPCGAEVMPAGRVDRIIDGRSFVLDDGREIRLAALEVPPAGDASPAGQAARAALASMLAGETVELRSAAPATDRYGRVMAYAFTTGEPRRTLVAHDDAGPGPCPGRRGDRRSSVRRRAALTRACGPNCQAWACGASRDMP